MALANAVNPTFETVSARQPVISGLGATRTLNESESGSLVLLDRAAGIVVTLPTTPNPGTYYDFVVTTAVTSNSYKVITGSAGEYLVGGYTNTDTDSSNAVASFIGNGSSHIAVTQAAASSNSTGGLVGSKLRFTCLSATQWLVEGAVHGAGTVATAFATS